MNVHQRIVPVLCQLHDLYRHTFTVGLEFVDAGLGDFSLDEAAHPFLLVWVLPEINATDGFEALLKRLDGDAPGSRVTIEDILSHIRSLQDVIREGSIDGLDKTSLAALDTAICDITTKVVNVPLPQARTAYHQLATWIGGVPRANAVELFTPNYDLLLEQGLEAGQIPYFDGFVGSKQAFFVVCSWYG